MRLSELHLWRDLAFRSAANNMALDEALFEFTLATGKATARFYTWDHPARTRGYFSSATEYETNDRVSPPVRRFTGGGLVEHGEDVTFVLTIPSGCALASAAGPLRYLWIHEAIAHSLTRVGLPLSLAAPDTENRIGPCFTHAVASDLLDPETGAKFAGGAQRRSRGAVIHQGSVRLPPDLRSPLAGWIDDFVLQLAEIVSPLEETIRGRLLRESDPIAQERYASEVWNRPE